MLTSGEHQAFIQMEGLANAVLESHRGVQSHSACGCAAAQRLCLLFCQGLSSFPAHYGPPEHAFI